MIRSVNFILFLLLISTENSYAQLISNQVNFGTISFDEPRSVIQLSDGNYLIASSSEMGISGSKTCSNYGNTDIWIFKMNSYNVIQWQLCYGGSDSEYLGNIVETNDGHILISGRSNSPVSGNKTVGTNGGFDFWVIKMDLDGNEVWQRNFGTSQNDGWPYISIVNSNNYVLVSSSSYGIDGDKSEDSYGGSDYWILSIDGDGNKLWDKTIGGTGQEFIENTGLYDPVNETMYVGGYSNSGIGGLKTEASYGFDDIWIVALDLQGNLINQKSLGGDLGELYSGLIKTNNSDMIVFGSSNSSITGTKTAPNHGLHDIWIIHLNENLEVVNDFTYGGSENDTPASVLLHPLENNIIIGGGSRSGISGNKTEDSRGQADVWILNVDYLSGEIIWQKTIGGSMSDGSRYLFEENDYYKVFCRSNSPISGDKTVGIFGEEDDIWIFDLSKTVGLEEFTVSTRQVYPNPSTGLFHVSLLEGETTRLFDLQGKEMAFICESGILDLSPLQDGVYILNVEKKDAEREILRLVKSN
jgi:hypothetical protein